jgi:hypothetical protein
MQISTKKLKLYQERTFRILPDLRLNSIDDAVSFVQERGFLYFWPIKGITLPNLWTAVAGDRIVADSHDDPGHITWGWKDEALGKRIWYYGKILRKKATLIDLNIVPYFYALSENYGNPEEDVRIQYQEGHLTLDAKLIFDSILENGPLDTISLRQKTRMTSKESNARFDRALSSLQADFKILPIGISDAGAWRYAFIYGLTHKYYPDVVDKARHIKVHQARKKLINLYFDSVGAAQFTDVIKLFRWKKKETFKAVQSLVEDEILVQNLEMATDRGEWIALSSLV